MARPCVSQRCYFVQVGRLRFALPGFLTPCTDGYPFRFRQPANFRFTLEIIHPRFGRLVRQSAVFREGNAMTSTFSLTLIAIQISMAHSTHFITMTDERLPGALRSATSSSSIACATRFTPCCPDARLLELFAGSGR